MNVPYFHKASRLQIILWTILIGLLFFTRAVNLRWGLPYPFHPDERNMVDAMMRLECPTPFNIQTCGNPEFFAYGQAPLYIGAGAINIWHILTGKLHAPILFSEAALSLRFQSVLYSLLTVLVVMKILLTISSSSSSEKTKKLSSAMLYGVLLLVIFQPYFIQFSHFGTTESLLMLLYTSIIYLSCHLVRKRNQKTIISLCLLVGVSIGIKISSILFAGVPMMACAYSIWKDTHLTFAAKIRTIARYGLVGCVIALCGAIITSPQSFIHYHQFLGSMNYEIAVGNGTLNVFYTRQFENTIPYLFQFLKVFPYSHGTLQLLLFAAGFLFLSWKDARINLLRLSFLVYFIPAGWTYVKWARFMAPIMPLMTLVAAMFLIQIVRKIYQTQIQTITFAIVIGLMILPGIAYLSIYQQPDTRYQASAWMAHHIKPSEHVLLETGNVINLPITDPQHPDETISTDFTVTPFDFYGLDGSPTLQEELVNELQMADYVVIASRRVFANHTCLWPDMSQSTILPFASGRYLGWCREKQHDYPSTNAFFNKLFTSPNYKLVQTFESPPQVRLWDMQLAQFSDEKAEEAWTVFDHPTVRIYKRI